MTSRWSNEPDLLAQAVTRIRRGERVILLDDQAHHSATLFSDPVAIIRADRVEDVIPALERLSSALDEGLLAAGFLSYGAGAAFDALEMQHNRLTDDPRPPLVWFGLFEGKQEGRIDPSLRGEAGACELVPSITRADYETMVDAGLSHIRAGDIYQVNLTMPTRFVLDDPFTFYRWTRLRTGASFGAIVDTGCRSILSFSPELFFDMSAGAITAKPMKGTRPRAEASIEDAANAEALASSAKDRAENLMIVDLLRNDLSRVCEAGSVRVPHLFEVESYPTVWQMTSTVTGSLKPRTGPIEILCALFPCGSITGAPKVMASRIISEQERFDRGVYTGSIGWMSAGRAVFNVAIRTVDVPRSTGPARVARLDVGAGIVADSSPAEEWCECVAKARFAGIIPGEAPRASAIGWH